MSVTTSELETNLVKYLKLSETEDVYITQNGRIIAKLTNPNAERIEIARSLFGIIPANLTLEEARDERISKI